MVLFVAGFVTAVLLLVLIEWLFGADFDAFMEADVADQLEDR